QTRRRASRRVGQVDLAISRSDDPGGGWLGCRLREPGRPRGSTAADAEAGQRRAGVAEHLARAVAPVGAADAAAGMGAGAAEVEVADRGPVVGVATDRAQGEELVEGHVAVQGMA